MKRTKIAAIDVGSAKVCTIMADMNGTEALRILGVGTAASDGLEKGVVINARDAAASVGQSVRKAEKMAGYRLKSAYVGVSGADMSSLNNHGLISISRDDQQVHATDRSRALEVARSVEVPGDQRLLHVIPRSYTLDGQENIKNPVGMHGFRLDVETHIITAPAVSVQNLARCIMSRGITVNGFVLKSLASAEAVLTEDEKQRGVVLADIGGSTTDVAVFKEGSVCHTSTLPVGGYNVTNDIALGLGLPFYLAEEVKTKYGNVTPSEEEGDGDVTVTENGHSISCYDLWEVIRARVEEILRLILFQMPQIDYVKAFPAGLVLTGGGCNLPGVAELGHEVTRFPVRIGVTFNPDDSNDTLCDPVYATSVGLLYWKMRNRDSQDWRTNRGGLSVLLPRWSSYFTTRK